MHGGRETYREMEEGQGPNLFKPKQVIMVLLAVRNSELVNLVASFYA